MNQNEIQKTIETNNLLLSIDLREEQKVRLEELAPVIGTLKERIGSLHASATVAYCDKGQVKYINLPVYVTENAQERIVNLFFPTSVQLTIWEDNQEKTINFLEYHLDKRTKNLTEISGVADTNDYSSVIIIPIDFTKTRDEYSAEIKALATKYYLNKTIFSKPVFLKYLWKEDYTDPQSEIIENLVYGKQIDSNYNQLVFSSPYKIIEVDEPAKYQSFNITLTLEESPGSAKLYIRPYEPLETPDTFFLYEDGSKMINAKDYNSNFGTSSWPKFVQAVEDGRKPAVYLCTPDSEKYYPAHYIFSWNGDKTKATTGTMGIQYIKEIDGKIYLCVDNMEFQSFGSGTYGPDDMTGENVTHHIQRIPLN